MTTIKEFTIFGERCSGTNWLQRLIETSFKLPVTWRFGWKHFPGFVDLDGADGCLFLCIVRNPYDWLASLFASPHHVAMHLRADFTEFLTGEFYSWYDEPGHIQSKQFGTEIMEDRHITKHRRYKNVLELRNVKNSYFVETLPTKVKHCCILNYDHLRGQVVEGVEDIANRYGLDVKEQVPVSAFDAKRGGAYQRRRYSVQDDHVVVINNGLDWALEEALGFRMLAPVKV